MRVAISFLALFSLFLIGSSIAQQNQIVASASVRVDPIVVTARYVALLQDYEDTIEWHNTFSRQFTKGSIYQSKQIDRIADVFQTMGEISKIGVRDAENQSGSVTVEVTFNHPGPTTVSKTLKSPVSTVIFRLATGKSSKIESISLNDC